MAKTLFSQPEHMSGVDTAWLRMEHPSNLMMIVGVMVFKEKLDPKKARLAIEQRFLTYRRFKQKAVQNATGSWWLDDMHFDPAYHLKKVKFAGSASSAELQAFVSQLAGESLDYNRPLWQMHLIEDYRGGSALIMRMHHCYADGSALLSVMLALTSKTAEESLDKPKKTETRLRDEMDFWTSVTKPAASVWNGAQKLTRGIIEQGLEMVKDPGTMREFAAKGMELGDELRMLTLLKPDTPSRFKGRLGRVKHVAWSDALSLTEMKAIATGLGCSINDILLATTAGALRNYLLQHGDTIPGLELRATVPVNLRVIDKSGDLGNQFGMVFVELPIDEENPIERLKYVRERMNSLRGSYQPVVSYVLLNAIGTGPKILQDQISALLGRNATTLISNVPGPQQALYFAGKEIADIHFWGPQSGGIGMGISAMSYNNKLQLGAITDNELVPDPENILEQFRVEFERLVLLTLMGSYGVDFNNVPSPRKKSRRGTRIIS